MIVTSLLAWQGNTHAVSVFMIALAVSTLIAAAVAKETAGKPMRA